MFKSYFKLALRNLWKHKTSTAINILSLSVGLAACSLVFLFFQHELSFDKDFANNADIYRVVSDFGGGSGAPTVPYRYATLLKNEIPEIEETARLDPTNGTVIVQVAGGGNTTPYSINSGYWVDPQFFDVLPFPFLQGNCRTAFTTPNTITLSATLAKTLFGNSYPIGKAIKVNSAVYTVTGVFNDNFLNHLHPDFLASLKNNQFNEATAGLTSWVANPNYYTYVKLKRGSNLQHVNAEIAAYTLRHAGPDMKATGDHMTNSLQALRDIHLHSFQYQDYLAYKQGNMQYLYLLAGIALAILLLGCINYMNLTTAQAIGRAREVGIRRVIGAGKNAIRIQFILETMTVTLCAMALAGGLAFLVLPTFNNFTGQQLSFFAPEDSSLFGWIFLITLTTGLLTGLYPAFYLSSFKAVQVLKGKVGTSSGVSFVRKFLIVSQFAISTVLVFSTLVIWDQLHFMINTKPGFDQDQQLVIGINSDEAKNNISQFMAQLKGNPRFRSVSGCSDALCSSDMFLYSEEKTIADKKDFFLVFGDNSYLQTLGLQLISGSNFSPQTFGPGNPQQDAEVHDTGREVIINEEGAKALGLDAYTAPGKYLSHLHEGKVYNYRIVGVVKNYHYFSLHAPIGPFAIMPMNPTRFSAVVAKANGRQMRELIQFAQQKWKALNPGTPFTYTFLNDIFRGDYIQDERTQQMAGIFTFVAIFISCLGLLGLITYSVAQKAREIGIRKVIGASVSGIVGLFAKQYLRLVVIANIIALPAGWYFMDKWLQGFSYRIDIGWWMCGLSMAIGIAVAFATISFKTVKAAMANPVDSLRAD